MAKKSLVFSFILTILTLSIMASAIGFVNAEILMSQPKAIYNMGDSLSLDITLDSLKEGYLNINLICPNSSMSLYHNVPDSLIFNINRQLTKTYIADSSGVCYLRADYFIDERISQSFLISKEIDLDLTITNASYLAGSSLIIKGTAIKLNNLLVGQDYNAFVEAIIQRFNETISARNIVKDGQFGVNFTIPEDMKAGAYSIDIRVFDEDKQGNLMNEGKFSSQINVIQKPARIEIAFDKDSILPGENVGVIPILYDMAGDEIKDKLLVKITGADSKVYFEGYVDSNFSISTETNYAPGEVQIEIQKEKIIAQKSFQIKELKKISSEIINRTLIIKNVGNVIYNDIIEVKIANETLLKEVNLAINESVEFYLSAPAGTYDVSVKDNNEALVYPGISLTGDAIRANAVGSSVFANYAIAWIFVALVIILGVYIFIRRYMRDRHMHFPEFFREQTKNVSYARSKGAVDVLTPENTRKNIDSIVLQGDVTKAQHEMVMNGRNQQAGIIAIKLKSQVSGIEKENLNKALEYAYKLKGASYSNGDYILIVFSPLLTGKTNNEETAIKAALDIDGFLKEHNRKFRANVISYGIGVNAGEIINIVEKGILKFASINKTITLARKIAEISSEDVLLSKEIHEKTMNNIKAEKVSEPSESTKGLTLFKIKRVVDTQASQKFINEFVKRQ